MGDTRGFLKVKRRKPRYRPVGERVKDYRDVTIPPTDDVSRQQASRCMDCGTPFCHSKCPVGNYIPEWNDMESHDQWRDAYRLLQATNNFPEFTGRVCPAPCEYACVLSINDDPVTIKENELSIIEHAFENGIVKAKPPEKRTGKKVAVVGSGPAGLACADHLNQAGHSITVFERDEEPGGILRYGIPDFKLEKSVIERRIDLMEEEGVKFRTGVHVGIDLKINKLTREYDAVCLAGGSRVPRDLKVPGRDLKGIYFAMGYLTQSNRNISGQKLSKELTIDVKGKKVLVIGGGDTGSDCVGTAIRQGAASVVQVEVLKKPSDNRPVDQPWPCYPNILKTSTSHEEGCERVWTVNTKEFIGKDGNVSAISCEHEGRPLKIAADIVILAMGFLHPEHKGLLDDLKLDYDQRGNVKTDIKMMTSKKGVFSAGDMRTGQSLVVWAISEGRRAAHNIDKFLMGKSNLPVI